MVVGGELVVGYGPSVVERMVVIVVVVLCVAHRKVNSCDLNCYIKSIHMLPGTAQGLFWYSCYSTVRQLSSYCNEYHR